MAHIYFFLLQTNPVFVSLTTDLTGLQATIGEPFTVTVDISIPAPATPGVATPYVLEVLAPFNAAGIFKVCSFEIVSIGRDMPCLNKDAIKPTYSTREAGGTTADGATLNLGKGYCDQRARVITVSEKFWKKSRSGNFIFSQGNLEKKMKNRNNNGMEKSGNFKISQKVAS